MSKYQYTDDMDEISGFGGSYEAECRSMVIAAMEWFDQNPNADPHFKGYTGLVGILTEDNKDAKALSSYITKGRDCTGAMHQAAISHAFYARKNGWEKYQEQMRERKTNE